MVHIVRVPQYQDLVIIRDTTPKIMVLVHQQRLQKIVIRLVQQVLYMLTEFLQIACFVSMQEVYYD